MKILITGICGFVGSTLAYNLIESSPGVSIIGLDNFSRPGSEYNRKTLKQLGVHLYHGDIRLASDFETIPSVEWVIDAAANPSVLAGIDGVTSSRQIVEHNLLGTINILEYCKKLRAGFTLISTSRVYSIETLSQLPVEIVGDAFHLGSIPELPEGVSSLGVNETFSTSPPISLYGSTKLASEALALEYGKAFDFPVWINRCGVLAGAGQFGRPDQGIFSFWVNSWLRKRDLKYIGFGGKGFQVRDCLHPRDLAPLLIKQIECQEPFDRVVNLGGGINNSMSLAQLSVWCKGRFGGHFVSADKKPRPFDIPWMVMDSSLAKSIWGWEAQTPLDDILTEIADHAVQHPYWLEQSGVL